MNYLWICDTGLSLNVKRIEDFQNVWTSYVRSIYVLCLQRTYLFLVLHMLKWNLVLVKKRDLILNVKGSSSKVIECYENKRTGIMFYLYKYTSLVKRSIFMLFKNFLCNNKRTHYRQQPFWSLEYANTRELLIILYYILVWSVKKEKCFSCLGRIY